MTTTQLAKLAVGDRLPDHECGPISRWVLAMFAGGSGDTNPIHIDLDMARKFGQEDVFAHGMLSMAYLAQLLTLHFPQERIRSYRVRFSTITPVKANVLCQGEVLECFQEDGEERLRIGIRTTIDDGTVTLEGEAVVAAG